MPTSNNYDTKLDDIEVVLNKVEKDVQKLIKYCSDKNAEVRFRAIEALGELRNQDTEEQVRKSLADSDELVKTSCLEILGGWKSPNGVELIIECLDDQSSLVKTAAAIALSDIEYSQAIDSLEKKLESLGEEERFSFYYALCRLGKDKYFHLFLNGLFHDLYRIRCVVSNLVGDLVAENNKELILNLLGKVLEDEESEAVQSSIKDAIDLIRKHGIERDRPEWR